MVIRIEPHIPAPLKHFSFKYQNPTLYADFCFLATQSSQQKHLIVTTSAAQYSRRFVPELPPSQCHFIHWQVDVPGAERLNFLSERVLDLIPCYQDHSSSLRLFFPQLLAAALLAQGQIIHYLELNEIKHYRNMLGVTEKGS